MTPLKQNQAHLQQQKKPTPTTPATPSKEKK
jgi:hypothetical protein